MKIILHCGETKTGSTALQTALYSQKDQLLDNGILYETDDDSGHYDLSLLVGKEQRISEETKIRRVKKAECIIESINAKIKTHKPKYLVLSSEYFYYYSKKQIEDTLNFFCTPFESIHAILYLRCPISHYLSAIQQALKASAKYPSPNEFKKAPARNIAIWKEHVGEDRLHLKVFKKDLLKDGCVIQDFRQTLSAITGRDIPPMSSIRTNVGLSAEQMIVLQKFRNSFLSDKDSILDPLSGRLITFFTELNNRKALPLSPSRLSSQAQKALLKNAMEACKEADIIYPKLGFFNHCFPCAEDIPEPSPSVFSSDISSILHEYNEEMVNLITSCIPLYNKRLYESLEGDFQDHAVTSTKAFYESLGEYLFAEGIFHTASKAFIRALRYDNSDPYLVHKTSLSFFEKGDIEGSIDLINKAISIKDDAPHFYLHLSKLMHSAGNTRKANEALRRAQANLT